MTQDHDSESSNLSLGISDPTQEKAEPTTYCAKYLKRRNTRRAKLTELEAIATERGLIIHRYNHSIGIYDGRFGWNFITFVSSLAALEKWLLKE